MLARYVLQNDRILHSANLDGKSGTPVLDYLEWKRVQAIYTSDEAMVTCRNVLQMFCDKDRISGGVGWKSKWGRKFQLSRRYYKFLTDNCKFPTEKITSARICPKFTRMLVLQPQNEHFKRKFSIKKKFSKDFSTAINSSEAATLSPLPRHH